MRFDTMPVPHGVSRQQRQKQHSTDDPMYYQDEGLSGMVRRQTLPDRHHTALNVVKRFGSGRSESRIPGHPAFQGAGPNPIVALGWHATQFADTPFMQVRLKLQGNTASLGNWRGRLARSPHGRRNDNLRVFRRYHGRNGLRLSPAALAQFHVGLRAVENQGIGGFGVTQQQYAGWHDLLLGRPLVDLLRKGDLFYSIAPVVIRRPRKRTIQCRMQNAE